MPIHAHFVSAGDFDPFTLFSVLLLYCLCFVSFVVLRVLLLLTSVINDDDDDDKVDQNDLVFGVR